MATMWEQQNPDVESEGSFNLGFNAGDVPVEMTEEVVAKLEEAIKNNYKDFVAVSYTHLTLPTKRIV